MHIGHIIDFLLFSVIDKQVCVGYFLVELLFKLV